MIPLRDHNPSHTVPIVTYLLILVNILVFGYMFTLPLSELENFIYQWALIPAAIASGTDWTSLLSSMFMHGSVGHIVGNMLFLNIFGDNLEEKLGHVKYLFFYILSGIAASFLQISVSVGSEIPNLGASGAIAGLMGGYLVLFPRHRIDILLPVFGLFQTATVPAFTMLFYWLVFQVFGGLGTLGIDTGGVAYFAHVGGFIAGVILIYLLPKRRGNYS